MQQTMHFGICLSDPLRFRYVLIWRDRKCNGRHCYFCNGLNVNSVIEFIEYCLPTPSDTSPHPTVLLAPLSYHLCWIRFTHFISEDFISEMLGERSSICSLWWRRGCTSVHQRFELFIRNFYFFSLNRKWDLVSSMASRCLPCTYVRLGTFELKCRQWREAKFEELFLVRRCRFSFPASPSSEEGNGPRQSLILIPAYKTLLSAAATVLQLFSTPLLSQLPQQLLLRLTITTCFLYFRKDSGRHDCHCL